MSGSPDGSAPRIFLPFHRPVDPGTIWAALHPRTEKEANAGESDFSVIRPTPGQDVGGPILPEKYDKVTWDLK